MSEANMNNVKKTPWHIWVVGIAGFLWSAIGAMDYVMTQIRNEAYMSAFTAEQLEFFYGLPTWAIATWSTAVWCGVAASIILLFRKVVAVPIFLVSLIAMAITTFQNYVLSNGLEVIGDTFSLVFTALIFLAALGLYLYARAMKQRGVLK